jgi:hypothetical protein
VKRHIALRIDDLRLPPGTGGGPRAAAAIRAHLEMLVRGGDAAHLPSDPYAAAARRLHDSLAPYTTREGTKRR